MDWQCSGCNRHYSWAVTECPYCQPKTMITTRDSSFTIINSDDAKSAVQSNRNIDLLEIIEEKIVSIQNSISLMIMNGNGIESAMDYLRGQEQAYADVLDLLTKVQEKEGK